MIEGFTKLPLPKFARLSLTYMEELIFDGKLDRLENTVDNEGSRFKIWARTQGGTLLDNEAKPATLWGANLPTVFKRHVGAYGFSLDNQLGGGRLPAYSINKGLSHWEAFSGFAKRLHGVTPYVKGGQVYCRRLTTGSPRLSFCSATGIPFSSFTHRYSPYEILSKVVIRNELGEYAYSVANSKADYHQVERVRYFIPPGEGLDSHRLSAVQLIDRSMHRSEEYTLCSPQLVMVSLGETVEIKDPLAGTQLLVVSGSIKTAGQQGYNTTLTLKKGDV